MATYVEISRQEMEDFLSSVARKFGTRFKRKQGTEGVYFIPFSKNVALRVSSSMGSKGSVVDRGRGAIKLALVSLVTGKPLATKKMKDYIGKTRINRTINWRDNLRKAIGLAMRAFQNKKDFFERIALGDKVELDTEDNTQSLIQSIESIPDWNTNNFLSSLYSQLNQGRILSQKQRTALDKIISQSKRAPVRQNKFELEELRNLYVLARKSNDHRAMKFLESVGKQTARGKSLSPKQQVVIEDIKGNLHRKNMAFKVASVWLLSLPKL